MNAAEPSNATDSSAIQNEAFQARQATIGNFFKSQPDVVISFEKDGQQGLFIDPKQPDDSQAPRKQGISINDMAGFFAKGLGDAELIKLIPQDKELIALPLADEVFLGRLALTHNTELDTFALQFTIGWAETVTCTLADGFELKRIAVSFDIVGTTSISAVLDAVLEVEKIPLDVRVSLPSLIFEAFMPAAVGSGTPEQMALVNKLVPQSKSTPAKAPLTLENFKVLIALREKRYALHLEVRNLLNLDPFELIYAELDILYTGGPTGAVTGKLATEIDLALGDDLPPLMISLSAERYQTDPNSEPAWRFAGGQGPDGLRVKSLIDGLAHKFKETPPTLPAEMALLTIDQLDLKYDTGSRQFDFDVEFKFDLNGGKTAVDVLLTATNKGPQGGFDINGKINLGGLLFTLELAQAKKDGGEGPPVVTGTYFVATYSHQDSSSNMDITALLTSVDSSLGDDLPDIKIDLKDLLFAFAKKSPAGGAAQNQLPPAGASGSAAGRSNDNKQFIFGATLGAKFDLSNIPLVGKMFPANKSLGVRDLTILYAAANLDGDEVNTINSLLPASVSPLPTGSAAGTPAAPSASPAGGPATGRGSATIAKPIISQGFTFGATLDIGGNPSPLSLPASPANDTPPAAMAALPPGQAAPQPTTTTWIDIQQSLGPVYFEKVGVDYVNKALWFRLTGSLGLAGLTIALEGLSFGSPITHFAPHFDLQGLGIDIQEGPVEIGGMFLRFTAKDDKGGTYDEYDGTLIVRTPLASIGAIGSYARYEGHPSLFLYLVIEAPLGGPPFFFVTGLAGGIGYNRHLTVPPVTQIYQFPLVAEAMGNANLSSTPSAPATPPVSGAEPGAADPAAAGPNANIAAMRNKIMAEIEGIRRYIRPEVNTTFLAVGVKYTSFEIVDSFALVTSSFGNHFELHVIGITTVSFPPGAAEGVPALVVIEVAVEASYLPDEGFLGVMAVLTSKSHLFDPNCLLTGGLAFSTWFGGLHKDEFVLTIGGYHPKFRAPAYYPQVPRLGLSWIFSSKLSIKGGAYFALTGHTLMAGGFLQALWDDGDLKAWIKIGADFLVTFKPFHYEGEFSVDIGAQATIHIFGTHHITIDLNADLKIWGPSFSGKATFHILFVSFTISFGSGPPAPRPIDWPTFRSSFLPANDQSILTLIPVDGLVKSMKGYKLAPDGSLTATKDDKNLHLIFNGKHFEMASDGVIPITDWHNYKVTGETAAIEPQTGTRVGVAPMDLRQDNFHSRQDFQIERITKGGQKEDVTGLDFAYAPVVKNLPAGLWGNVFQPNVNSKTSIPNVTTGLRLTPRLSGEGDVTHSLPRANLSYDTELVAAAFDLKQSWTVASQVKATAAAGLKATATAAAQRDALLNCFAVDPELKSTRYSVTAADLLCKNLVVETI